MDEDGAVYTAPEVPAEDRGWLKRYLSARLADVEEQEERDQAVLAAMEARVRVGA